jgi:hypothetical protein
MEPKRRWLGPLLPFGDGSDRGQVWGLAAPALVLLSPLGLHEPQGAFRAYHGVQVIAANSPSRSGGPNETVG